MKTLTRAQQRKHHETITVWRAMLSLVQLGLCRTRGELESYFAETEGASEAIESLLTNELLEEQGDVLAVSQEGLSFSELKAERRIHHATTHNPFAIH